jgi:putative hemolysin
MDGTDGYTLRNDSKENGDVSSECEENEGTECENAQLTDDEDGESDSDW